MKTVASGAFGENEVSVTGGGAPSASLRRLVTVSDVPASFGVENYELTPENEDGSLDAQAGSHPFQLTTTLAVNRATELKTHEGSKILVPQEAGLVKDLDFKWPAGLIGNPTVFPQCTIRQFSSLHSTEGLVYNECPPDTAVGVALATINEPAVIANTGLLVTEAPLLILNRRWASRRVLVLWSPEPRCLLIRRFVAVGTMASRSASMTSPRRSRLLSEDGDWVGRAGDPRHDRTRGWGCINPSAHLGCAALGQSRPPAFPVAADVVSGEPVDGGPGSVADRSRRGLVERTEARR